MRKNSAGPSESEGKSDLSEQLDRGISNRLPARKQSKAGPATAIVRASHTEPNRPCLLRRLKELLYGLKDNGKLLIVFALHCLDFAPQVSVGDKHFSQLHKGSHNLNINPNRPGAI